MRTFFTSLICLLPLISNAQSSPCNDFRFLQVIFTDTQSTDDVKYGENTTIGGVSQDLLMDIYEPQGDTASTRIAIVLAAGGAFSGGDRGDLKALCENFATRGYVAIAIDTRPFDLTLNAATTETQMLDWLFKAATDVKAAVRFLRQETDDGNLYGINPEAIFIGGVSTGALAATHAAMVSSSDNVGTAFEAVVAANGGWEGNSNEITAFPSAVRGVVSYSGGLVDASWLDGAGPLFIAFHDESDSEIPFTSGAFSPGGVTSPLSIEGSSLLAQQADALSVFHELNSSTGSGHVSYLANAAALNNTAVTTAEFIHEVNCDNIISDLFEAGIDNP